MNFAHIYNETIENLRLALLSLWAPGKHPMRKAIEELFDREPLISEPVFQSTFSWKKVGNDDWRSSLDHDVWEKLERIRREKAEQQGKKFKPFVPFKHQAQSWEALAQGKSIVVTSGTGSGKTECFMYPVLSDLYAQPKSNAIQAIFLYPLNALMEDQKTRLSEYCEATRLHFAVYNGDTPEYHATDELLPCEIATRDLIRDNDNQGTRPQILLSNPSMLEYILVRSRDQKMLQESKGKLRWIVIDEAHSYSGSSAVELAYQIKRIIDAFGGVEANKDLRFACTSATMGSKDGKDSLASFISTIIGQPVEKIQVIDGKRLVPQLDKVKLADELRKDLTLPSPERVLQLREKINNVPGMTLNQIWECLMPEKPYEVQKALQLVDKLCELSIAGNPVMSLRAHYFMRAISGLYACGNPECKGAGGTPFGHVTTYKSTVCPDCGAPLLELVQCKRCGSYVMMGTSSSQSPYKVSPCEDIYNQDDYFSVDVDPDEEGVDSEETENVNPDTFFIVPYDKKSYFNPLNEAHASIMDLVHKERMTTLVDNKEGNGKWVDLRKDSLHSYCPNCGRLAQGEKLYLKHFRIPINFINQTISPVFLHECAPQGRTWGKYIAFTDSRQGTAISAKTFNINVERIQARERMLDELVNVPTKDPEINLSGLNLSQEIINQILAQNKGTRRGALSLSQVSDCIYNGLLFEHIAGKDRSKDLYEYKAALIRQIIGRKSLYESNSESMGLISLIYPGLKNIHMPSSLTDYIDGHNVKITDEDWRDFLKICLDYYFRMGNHIQPLIDGEKKYVRDNSLGTPVSGPDDIRKGVSHWPTVLKEKGKNVTRKQGRVVLLLCAGLGIHTFEELQANEKAIGNILRDAWNQLVENKILTEVRSDLSDGYNDPRFYPDGRYVGCYYLDLSGTERNQVCRVELATRAVECPVTYKLLDTTFCGYSPLITGEISRELIQRFKCKNEAIELPVRPKDNDQVTAWLREDKHVKKLKELGLWSDRHKYAYHKTDPYIAAEHSAQQSKSLLREYTKEFTQKHPTINVLHCSTTMEMGVDIGDIDVVLMDTVPPTAANYLQRVGRAGRMGQTKAIAFSLCNNTPVGLNAFTNPMWALQTVNYMVKVQPSQTIIQRHINSYFFRLFICGNGQGLQGTNSVSEFMDNACEEFERFLDRMSTNKKARKDFKKVFGDEIKYTIKKTADSIKSIKDKYDSVVSELSAAYEDKKKDSRAAIAISNQLNNVKRENLLNFLSEEQFLPNANMPTDVVTFNFMDRDQSSRLRSLYNKLDKTQSELQAASEAEKPKLKQDVASIRKQVQNLRRATTANRDIRTALNEYAPGQTVVVNEKNYVSAGVMLFGAYNENTQNKAIYYCSHCGNIEYSRVREHERICPKCGNPFHGILDKEHTGYTLAYEPVGFRTDQSVDGSREEKTEKHYYDMRPILLEADWKKAVKLNMCQVTSSGETGRILFMNAGSGHGFAFCKRCGRAAVEWSKVANQSTLPNVFYNDHNRLWGDKCDANLQNDIARQAVLTGIHYTCYSVFRFQKGMDDPAFEKDAKLAYSLGVILKRALAEFIGIDENEVDYGVKEEDNATLLFIFDTAKGGCGYSLHFTKPDECEKIFDIARRMLSEYTCRCEIDGGACARCLIDRNNYRVADKLSKGLAIDWLEKQKGKEVTIPESVRRASPNAKVIYQSLHNITTQAIEDSGTKAITFVVSDRTGNYSVTDWISVRSEMGKLLNRAAEYDKDISIKIEYHPELHRTVVEKMPFIDLNSKFPDCQVTFIKDLGNTPTALIVKNQQGITRYFTNNTDATSFSNYWGKGCDVMFADNQDLNFEEQDKPTIEVDPSEVIRQGETKATQMTIKHYFRDIIAKAALQAPDKDLLKDILWHKKVVITFSDMYVNSALSSLMLVYLIDDLKSLFGFSIQSVGLRLDSPRRKCENYRFNEYTYISSNFPTAQEADSYTKSLFENVLDVTPTFSSHDAKHPRWLKIETENGGSVEIRPDHGISGGWRSKTTYMSLDSLDGNVVASRYPNEVVLYYIIIKK